MDNPNNNYNLNSINASLSNRVLIVGGCFDILHPGHIDFLQKAKKLCDFLVVFLESDEKVKWLKGENRPVNKEEQRKNNLKKLFVYSDKKEDLIKKKPLIDKIIVLPFIKTQEEYKHEVEKIIEEINKIPPARQEEIPTGKLISLLKTNRLKEIKNTPPYRFFFGVTKNDRNKIKNEKIYELANLMKLEVIEVNELDPKYSTTKILQS